MLAIASAEALSILDQTALKKSFYTPHSSLALSSPPVASSWSSDNKFLFIASENVVQKYDVDRKSLMTIYRGTESISSLVVKDTTVVIIAAGEQVQMLECSSIVKISETFNSHTDIVTSLSLSNDSTLCASTSRNAVHVHDLVLSSHTPLQGLPVSDQYSIETCTFHSHSRTRLLLGISKQFVIYDINRPSGPLKVIPLNDNTPGNITAISCSPFSKTLIAIATSGGTIGLVDLDKEKGLFRIINVKSPVASLSFSQEGASIYVGTEDGKLLILDLRALDKPPKCLVISDLGARLATMSVQVSIPGLMCWKSALSITQVKTKPAAEPLQKPVAASKSTEPISSGKASATISSVQKLSPPLRTASSASSRKGPVVSSARTTKASLAKESLSSNSSIPMKPTAGTVQKHTRSPASKSPTQGAVGRTGLLRPPPRSSPLTASSLKSKASLKGEPSQRPRTTSTGSRTTIKSSPLHVTSKEAKQDAGSVPPIRTRTVSTTSSRAPKASTSSGGTPRAGNSISPNAGSVPPNRTRTVSTTSSRAPKTSTSSGGTPRPGKSSSPTSGSTKAANDRLTAPKDAKKARFPSSSGLGRTGIMQAATNSSTSRSSRSQDGTKLSSTSNPVLSSNTRTPSPDLSDIETIARSGPEPVTPMPRQHRAIAFQDGQRGDEGEDIDLLARTHGFSKKDFDKGKTRTVLFQDDGKKSDSEQDEKNAGSDDENESEKENHREGSLSWQISPRRPEPTGLSASTSAPWKASPLRHSQSQSPLRVQYPNIPASPGGTSPRDLLRNIVRDVMYDFHQESRADMIGLHLDLVRMGRGWKKELRELMGEYNGELEELREENRRLREENERLRRGY
ncbi:WD40-repeat-containing domain protein [Lentinula raphanica]|nr:WD40-repeat-containing domain protein [Lentinula raphanica]